MKLPDGWDLDALNTWIAYHGTAAEAMTRQRTALESQLVPVTAYIMVSAVECYRRHPEMVRAIASAMAPEDIGAAGRRPGNQVDAVHLWSLANIFLLGRQVLMLLGRIGPDHEPERIAVVLDFWRRAAGAFRADGDLQAFDGSRAVRRYDADVVEALSAQTRPPDDVEAVRRLSATLTSYMFLLYFDTRAGYQDTGPYDLGHGRSLLVRDFSKMGASDFPWSEVVGDVPYRHLMAAFVLDGVELEVNDWGTSVTRPADPLSGMTGFGLFTTDDGALRPVDPEALDALRAPYRDAQRRLYRHIAGLTRRERIDAGAFVYFTFLRPFAEVAGCDVELDWTVPRDSLDVYDWIEPVTGSGQPPASDLPYYWPVPSA